MCLIMQSREKISSMLEGAEQKGEGSAIPDYTRVKTKLLPGSGNGKSLDMLANTCPHKPVRLWPSWLLVARSPLAMARLWSLLQINPFITITVSAWPSGPSSGISSVHLKGTVNPEGHHASSLLCCAQEHSPFSAHLLEFNSKFDHSKAFHAPSFPGILVSTQHPCRAPCPENQT